MMVAKLTQREIEILRGLVGTDLQAMGKKLDAATAAAESQFYRVTMAEFHALDDKLEAMDARSGDTSQDADEDEYVVGEDEDAETEDP